MKRIVMIVDDDLPGVASVNGEMTQHDEQLDARGLHCPLPILKAKRRLHELNAGEVLSVLADDPGSVKDFEAFSRQTGNELVKFEELPHYYRFVLRKTA